METVEVFELRLKADSAVFVVVGEAIDQRRHAGFKLVAGRVQTAPRPEVFWGRGRWRGWERGKGEEGGRELCKLSNAKACA